MARIAGVDLPREKRVEIGLTYIYGIGQSSADKILAATGVNPDTRVKDLTDDEVKVIANYIAEHQTVEGDLRRQTALISRVCRKLAATVASVTERVSRLEVRRQRPTPEHVRDLVRL